MNKVISSYDISLKTIALLPARDIDYDTVVIEVNETKHIRKTSLNLIKEACLMRDWTTYEGRRNGVIKHTNFKQKTPIPIDIHKGIYFFPTHSPSNIDNIWIAFHHILSIENIPAQERTKDAQSIVYFKNRQTLKLSISFHTLKEQYNRTLQCVMLIDKLKTAGSDIQSHN